MVSKREHEKLLKAAELIVKSIDKKIGYYTDDKPVIHEDWDGTVAIAWDGLSNWAMNDGHSLSEEVGFATDAQFELEPFYSVPKGIHAEPYNGSVLCLYIE